VSDNIKLRKNHFGFTIVELTLSMVVMSILFIGLSGFMFNSFGIVNKNAASSDMSIDSQNLLRATVETLRFGAGVRQSNTINDANQPTGWSTSNSNFVIIISVPALNSSKNYIINPDTGTPYLNELVYYKDGSLLKQRILANPAAVGNTISTTCPDNNSSSSCTSDKRLVDNVKSMVFTLYDQDNGVTSDPLMAESIGINLVMERIIFGEIISFTNNIRVTLRNNFT